MNCTWQPLTPPPWFTWSIASSADCAIFFVIGAIEPVRGKTPPILTGQAACAAASPLASRPNANAAAKRIVPCMEFLRCEWRSLVAGVARDNGCFADQAARPIEQHQDQQ